MTVLANLENANSPIITRKEANRKFAAKPSVKETYPDAKEPRKNPTPVNAL